MKFCWRYLFHTRVSVAAAAVLWTHGGDGVQRVMDGQQQNLVPAAGLVGAGGPADPLAGGEVEEGPLLGHAHSLARAARHAAPRALHAVELHQSLALEGHHHHVAARRARGQVRRGGRKRQEVFKTSINTLRIESERQDLLKNKRR